MHIKHLLRETLSENGLDVKKGKLNEGPFDGKLDEYEVLGRMGELLASILIVYDEVLGEYKKLYKKRMDLKSSYVRKLFGDSYGFLQDSKKKIEGFINLSSSVMKRYMIDESENWIDDAIKEPGRIKKMCGGEVTDSCLGRLEKKAKVMLDSDDEKQKQEGKSLLSAVNLARRFRKGDLKK